MLKIWTLMENTACDGSFQAEHGLSLYIETGEHRILFDAGQTGAFADNAIRLGIDLKNVNIAVLSHGHYDHGGGLPRFLEINGHARIHVSEYAVGEYYNASGRYIGLPEQLKTSSRLQQVRRKESIAPGITLYPGSGFYPEIPIDHAGLQKKENGRLVPEDFLHEQYLLLEEDGKRVLLSGCSHRGIRNIIRWIDCDAVIGGFHFSKTDPEDPLLRETAEEMRKRDTVYYTCHCTGQKQYEAMKRILGDRLHYLAAGSMLAL